MGGGRRSDELWATCWTETTNIGIDGNAVVGQGVGAAIETVGDGQGLGRGAGAVNLKLQVHGRAGVGQDNVVDTLAGACGGEVEKGEFSPEGRKGMGH